MDKWKDEILRQAIHGVTPGIAVKARRVGGSTHQVPIEIGSTQGKALAIRWLLAASRKRPGRNMASQVLKVHDKYRQSPILQRKLNEVIQHGYPFSKIWYKLV